MAGLAATALAILVFIGGSSTPTCDLTAAAAGAIVTGVTHGKDVTEILAPVVTGAAVPGACKSVVNTLISKPDTHVALNLTLPNGTQTTTALNGSQLSGAPTSSAPRSCANWAIASFRAICYEGHLPPVAP